MIRQYVHAWDQQDLAAYTTEFGKCWAVHGTYTDPNFEINSLNGLAELAHTSLPKMPTRFFHVLTVPDFHHNVGRYTWSVDTPEGTKEGFDYFEFNEVYKITRLVSFFGPLTAATA